MNSDKSKLRKYQDDLDVCGFGIIILGAWSVVKLVMQIFLDSDSFFDFGLEDLGSTEEEQAVAAVAILGIIALLLVLSVIIFLIRFYIGRNASKAAKEQPYKKGYYVWAIIFLVLDVASMYTYVDEIKDLENIETTIASLVVDLTTIYILANIVIATNKIKSLKKAGVN